MHMHSQGPLHLQDVPLEYGIKFGHARFHLACIYCIYNLVSELKNAGVSPPPKKKGVNPSPCGNILRRSGREQLYPQNLGSAPCHLPKSGGVGCPRSRRWTRLISPLVLRFGQGHHYHSHHAQIPHSIIKSSPTSFIKPSLN